MSRPHFSPSMGPRTMESNRHVDVPTVWLVALESSDADAPALALARDVGRTFAAPLVLTHAVDRGADATRVGLPSSLEPAWSVMRARIDARLDDARRALDAVATTLRADGLRVTTHLAEGRPWEAILDYASRTEGAGIVVGRHGRRGVLRRERHLGSTADRVLRHARCPVWLAATAERGWTSASGPPNWLAAVDFSDATTRVLAHAAELARRRGGTVHAAHVIDTRDDDASTALHAAIAEALADALRASAEQSAQQPVREHVRHGAAPEALAELVEELDAAAVVLGAHGHGTWLEAVFGTTAERIVRAVDRPCLVVRPR